MWTAVLPGSRFVRRLLAVIVSGLVFAPAASRAQAPSMTAVNLKAGFEFSFVKFTEWPADVVAPGSAITLCIVDNKPLATALQQAAAGHAVAGHELHVVQLKPGESARGCQVVDTGGLDAKGEAQLLLSLKGASVLTVGDSPHSRGGAASCSSSSRTTACASGSTSLRRSAHGSS